MPRLISSLLCTFLAAAMFSGGASCSKPKSRAGDATTPFAVGQVWSYHSRKGEEDSRFVICKIEEDPRAGRLVHIAVNNLKMKNLISPSGFSDNIVHLPFADAALRSSVIELEGITTSLPPYENGYNVWRQSFDNKVGGVWTVPLAEAIADQEKLYSSAITVTPSTSLPASLPAQ